MKSVITQEFLEVVPESIRDKLRLEVGTILEFDESTPYLKATVAEAGSETADEFDRWLTESTGMAKGQFTTDELMRETRGDD
jgi:hypothetical protein